MTITKERAEEKLHSLRDACEMQLISLLSKTDSIYDVIDDFQHTRYDIDTFQGVSMVDDMTAIVTITPADPHEYKVEFIGTYPAANVSITDTWTLY